MLLLVILCAVQLLPLLSLKIGGGSYVALITPMKENKNVVDYNALEKLLNWHVQQGSNGLVILGTTGEGSLLSFEERQKIILKSVEVVKKRIPLIVGTGTIDTKTAIANCKQAKDNGADATLIITPYYVKPPQRALVEHFTTIAETVDIPHILYNCPGRTGVDMKPETIAICSRHERIIGVKDATGDLNRVESIRKLTDKTFLIFSGEDDSGCEFVRIGGDGVISVTANVAPNFMAKMLNLSKNGQKQEAEEINSMLMPLHKRLFIESNPIPVKKALEFMGIIESGILPPLTELDEQFYPLIVEALKFAKVI